MNRFGKGIYTSSTSSKYADTLVQLSAISHLTEHRSNDYTRNPSTSALKAMLLNKVVVGRGQKLLTDNTSLTAPPAGYDSVMSLLTRNYCGSNDVFRF
jgi:hypothetical protein